jgi:hypothetical protein
MKFILRTRRSGWGLIILPVIFNFFTANLLVAQITNVRQSTESLKRFEKLECDIGLKGEWTNPYDYTDLAVDMIITAPSGGKIVQPCFYYSGDPHDESLWKARFTPREVGKYSYVIELRKRGVVISKSPVNSFTSSPSAKKGFLNPNNLWTLRYDNGDLFRGIGENFCWESRDEDDSKYFKTLHEDKRFNYEHILKKLASNGGNFFRTWMIYWNLPVDWKTVSNNSRYSNTTSPYNESGMKRLDELVSLCDSLGIHMMLALESHVGYMGEDGRPVATIRQTEDSHLHLLNFL